jgi:hypothetical protein
MIINMTPHPVNVIDTVRRSVKTYPASGRTIRLTSQTVSAGMLEDGTPITRTVFGEHVGLPEYQEGTFYIVSQLVKSALPDRKDLLVPAGVMRDGVGNIIGCRSLGM